MVSPDLARLLALGNTLPVPSIEPLIAFGHSAERKLKQAIDQRLLASQPQDTWADQATALRELFNHHDSHSFGVAPHQWLTLLETQATAGLAHFLGDGTGHECRARVLALFAACGDRTLDGATIDRVGAIAEPRLRDGKRLDLFTYARGRDDIDHILVIEAKFGHEVGPAQLRSYEEALPAYAAEHGLKLDTSRLRLLLVGSRLTPKRRTSLAQNTSWRFLTWRELVLGLDRHVGRDADDNEFRRFRRTIWERGA